MNLHQEAKPVILDLVRCVVGVLPEGWTGAKLTVKETFDDSGIVVPRHKLESTEGRDEIAIPDDAVFEATGRLAGVFRAHEEPWVAIELTVRWLSDREKWDYTIDFGYSAATQAAIAKKNGAQRV